jgi:hypothetical protein
MLEHTTKDLVEDIIFSEVHNKRYTMAGEAPICKGELFKDFGYVVNTPALIAVLDGTYAVPQDVILLHKSCLQKLQPSDE